MVAMQHNELCTGVSRYNVTKQQQASHYTLMRASKQTYNVSQKAEQFILLTTKNASSGGISNGLSSIPAAIINH